MPNPNEFPESNSMLDDLLATDKLDLGVSEQEQSPAALQFESVEGFIPVDMRLFAAADFSIIIGCLMKRLDLTEITISDEERQGLDSTDPSLCTVLVCEADNSTQDVRFSLLTTAKSEFRP